MTGSTDVTTQMTNFVVLKGVGTNDLNRIGVDVPDMSEYGGGNAGVAATLLKDPGYAPYGEEDLAAVGWR
ncbi:hypothetical protein ACTWPT_55405 [Nonomuraea sp. 3N208]|uniref:hypothetical protein n=1 Tax=Nonomuraea sp. 3N208 TaxID=3457421 RepID=UPI003FD0F0BE